MYFILSEYRFRNAPCGPNPLIFARNVQTVATGLVTKSTGSWYSVVDERGMFYACRLRGRFRIDGIRTTNPIAVGDKVMFELETGKGTGVIVDILPRKNAVIRKATRQSSAAHIIAANLDFLLLIATLSKPRTSTGFIDRFLATAEAYHIPAALVFNKIDLLEQEEYAQLQRFTAVYEAADYPVLHVSALTGQNISALSGFMKDKVILLSGHSGVGKTALINTLIPNLNLRTAAISDKHQKGRHTTTFAEAFSLPRGGWLIDTPGIKEFGLYDLDKETLAQRFPEMRKLMHNCRFTNCTHIHEPGCAVKQAVDQGLMAETRYRNYLNMMLSDFSNDN